MPFKSPLIILLGVLLGACAQQTNPMLDTTPASPENRLNLDMALDTDIPLTLRQVGPIFFEKFNAGTYLQKVTTKAQGQEFTLTVHLSIENQKIEFIALNDIYGRIYHLVWTPDQLIWEASEHLPETVRPEHIILDFLLIHLPNDDLKTLLAAQGNRVQQKAAPYPEKGTRLITEGNTILRDIKRDNQQGIFWKMVTLHNPKYDYTLHIETVQLS